MKPSILKTAKLAAATALTLFAFTGCNTSSSADITTDGGNAVVSQETNNMGIMLNEPSDSPKVANTDTVVDVITNEKVIVLRHYDVNCQCFVRAALFTSSVGFERQRLDSIWLDSSGHLLSAFTPGHADSITHIRHVTRINNNTGRQIDLTFKSTLTRKLVSGVYVFNWNGVITGSFNGTEFTNSTIVITRTFGGSAGFGTLSGTIDVHRGNYEMVFVFDSATGIATCTVTHNGVVVRVTHITGSGSES